ncbi:helix-turn-helix transcriptional regulator [Nocardioides pinisoli]|uniref:LuxR C-terminal-related transcriptional regulator n=1 Tax=Nocardioides pinisoli TaxID=2950279 RepID=A0ABT1L2L7_9ACTN|nr:LuxR C-terminal-related transcriptional regulator [Nocardioides pinisoli]MCP3423731.1 LuxR C-terminal-related transcriptional regulator [Nocardioides pinisoli]
MGETARSARDRAPGRHDDGVRDDEAGVPHLPQTFVARFDLWRRLDAAAGSTIVTLVAPAGAGKTLGVAGWLRNARPRASRGDVLWLDAGRGLDHAVVETALGDPERAGGGPPRLLVVDDAHALPSSAVRLIDDRLTGAPHTMRLLLLSRWDLPLTRIAPQLRGHLTELRGDVLRLSADESSQLIERHVGPSSPEVVSAIAAHADGWCAVAVLASRLVAASPDQQGAVRRLAQGGSTVADQVVNEVFSTLSSRERHLLLCTASEHEVSAERAAHLTHDRGAGLVLDGLESTGLLVTRSEHSPLAAPPRTGPRPAETPRFRIHPLLAEVVRRRISAGGVDVERARSSVLRAVQLDASRGARDDAFGRLADIGLAEPAVRQLVEDGTRLLTRGHGKDVVTFAHRWPDVVDAHPECWFVLAVERWTHGDITSTMHWLDRLVARSADDVAASPRLTAQVLCAHLMRARAGFEDLAPVVQEAQQVVGSTAFSRTPSDLQPHVLAELGIAQLKLGLAVPAEANLLRAAQLGDELDMPAHAASAFTHLAGLYYMRGREHVAQRLAERSLHAMKHLATVFPVIRHRAELYGALARMSTLPVPTGPDQSPGGQIPTAAVLHPADTTTRFWQQVHDARVHLTGRSVIGAEQTLQGIMDVPGLPRHLRATVLVERAYLAALCDDRPTVRSLADELDAHGSTGEALLLRGVEADLVGDLRHAAEHLAAAVGHRMLDQPPCRALALVGRGQLLHALGEHGPAREVVLEAVRATESRGNYVPFLGWSRHGTPVHTILTELGDADPTTWLGALRELTREHSDITADLAPSTATTREWASATDALVTTRLSPRERDVLRELARGATYADIAAGLYVSENTVKTHVSSLYNKLGAGRRSEALSTARRLRLI